MPNASLEGVTALMGARAQRLKMDDEWRVDGSKVPEELGPGEPHAQAALRARVAPGGGPPVVVDRRAIAQEVLGVEHVLQEVGGLDRGIRSTVHRLVRHPA